MPRDQFLYGMNAGGAGYTDSLGNLYVADSTGIGNSHSTGAAIAGTLEDTLYQSEAWSWGALAYGFALSPGTYIVELNFAEIYFSSAGQRSFDVLLEGSTVASDLDLVQTVGANTAYVIEQEVTVTDGTLNLSLLPGVENPKLSALSIWSVTDAPDPDPDVTPPSAAITLSGGDGIAAPLIVTVTYSDDLALDPATIELADLALSGPASYVIQDQSLSFAPDGTGATATYSLLQEGTPSLAPLTLSLAAGAYSDAAGNPGAALSTSFTPESPFAGIAPVESYGSGAVGRLGITVTPGSGVQSSTYGETSFQVSNLGDKRIAALYIDISGALLRDAVFDPQGLAGDDVARGVTYGSTGATGAALYSGADLLTPFRGAGGSAGYEGLLITFDPGTDNGFEGGEVLSFGVDVDPNSIIGIPQSPVDDTGADPRLSGWDIGGVSGAELIGASVQVLFTDGQVVETQLISDGSQGGALGLAAEDRPELSATLTVNGTDAGGSGTWGASNSVTIEGPAGQLAQVVMMQGFAQPFDYTAPDGTPVSTLARLAASGDPFLANNALALQVVEVTLTGAPQEIAPLFDFAAPGGALAFPGDEALPLAFTTVLVDAAGNPIGPASAPLYLQPAPQGGPTVEISLTEAESALHPLAITVTYSDPDGLDPASLSLAALQASYAGGPLETLWQDLTLAADGQSATARYGLLPEAGTWESQTLSLALAAGAAQDLAGNGSDAAFAESLFAPTPGPEVDSLSDFTQLALQGVSLNNPTSIDVGADGRLYVSQQNGLIVALTIARTVETDASGNISETWAVTGREDIDLVQSLPNHDDTGIYQPGVQNRQVTGLVTTTDAAGNIVLYVGSSDPRIGGGGSGNDLDLDTNSGILSRLTQQADGTWQKLDLVRGLPRSEENHAINGMALHQNAQGEEVLLLTVGGFTNTGAQSNNFAYTSEYYYSASVVEIDLPQLAAMEAAGGVQSYQPGGSGTAHAYLYDLPTLDDITRANGPGGDLAGDGSTTADVFGGNDGLNQAIHDPLEIVRVVYAGFRNHYDITVTPAGEVYTVDNGSNTGWGGITVNTAGAPLLDLDGDGLADNGPGVNLPNNAGPDNADSLLRLDDNLWAPEGMIYYGGHPNLFRAYGAEAGVYLFADSSNPWGVGAGTPLDVVGGALTPTAQPVDLAGRIPNADLLSGQGPDGSPLTDPRQALQLGTGSRQEGLTDTPNGALYTFFSSTNGLDLYEGAGALQGDLITVSFNGSIYAVKMAPDGSVSTVESRALTSAPLDLVTQGAVDPYPGVIFVAAYGADQIVILSPDAGAGVLPDPTDRDQDGIDDTIDPFAADPDNGLLDPINPGEVLFWSFVNGEPFPNDRESLFDGTGGLYNGGDVGFTGIMTNRGGLPESLYVQDNIIFGGAPGVLQVKQVDPGDASTDSQRNGFQIGTTVGEGTNAFTLSSLIDNFLDEVLAVAGENLSQGIFLGAGDQNNFVSLALVRLADGRTGYEVTSQFAFDFIGETPPQVSFYEVPELAAAGPLDGVELFLDVTVTDGLVTPRWSHEVGGVTSTGTGAAVALQGDALAALEGTLTLPDNSGGQVATGLALGVVSSRAGGSGGGTPGGTVAALSAGGDESFTVEIDGTPVTFVPDTAASNVSLTGASATYGTGESIDFGGGPLNELHTEERYAAGGAPWGYAIESGNGTFQVDLYFAEIYSGTFAPGARVFDLLVEGATVAPALDIFAAVGANAHYVVTVEATVSDGVLDIAFASQVENAKLSGLLVRDLAGAASPFAADWDHLRLEGSGTPPPDLAAPTAALALAGGTVADDPVTLTVTYTDNAALDPATLSLADLTISGAGSYSILSQELTLAPDGSSATASYSIIQDLGWTSEAVTFSLAAGAVADTSGNLSAAASAQFTYDAPPPDVTAPTVAFALAGGGTATEPLQLTLTYSDAVALDPATLSLADLAISGPGSYSILSQDLSLAPDGMTATASYSIAQSGGWSSEAVTFALAEGAFADAAGNLSAAASTDFLFTGPAEDLLVFALNAGGGDYLASDGTLYQADTFGVGSSHGTSAPISGTTDDTLYQSETWNWNQFTYEIPIENGTYRVDLHFAEIYAPLTQPGARVFDIFLEGDLALDDMDPVAAAGGQYAAHVESTMVTVSDGALTLLAVGEVENPKISGISIWQDADSIA